MIAMIGYYWPLLLVSLLVGIVSGVLAYRAPRNRKRN